jgi:hypothetical protein
MIMEYIYIRSEAALAVFGHHNEGREIPSGAGIGIASENAAEVEHKIHERHKISFKVFRVFRVYQKIFSRA